MEPAGFPGLSEVEGSLREPEASGLSRSELRVQWRASVTFGTDTSARRRAVTTATTSG